HRLRLVIRHDARRDDDRRVDPLVMALGYAQEELVEVVLVVRRELLDHLFELLLDLLAAEIEPRLAHGVDRGETRDLGELARRVEGVVDVEEDRSKLSHDADNRALLWDLGETLALGRRSFLVLGTGGEGSTGAQV